MKIDKKSIWWKVLFFVITLVLFLVYLKVVYGFEKNIVLQHLVFAGAMFIIFLLIYLFAHGISSGKITGPIENFAKRLHDRF